MASQVPAASEIKVDATSPLFDEEENFNVRKSERKRTASEVFQDEREVKAGRVAGDDTQDTPQSSLLTSTPSRASLQGTLDDIMTSMKKEFNFAACVARLTDACKQAIENKDYFMVQEAADCLYQCCLFLPWKDIAREVKNDVFEIVSNIKLLRDLLEKLDKVPLKSRRTTQLILHLSGASIYSHVRDYIKATVVLENTKQEYELQFPPKPIYDAFKTSRVLGMLAFEEYKLTIDQEKREKLFVDALYGFTQATDFIREEMKFLGPLAVFIDVPFDVTFNSDVAQSIYLDLEWKDFPTETTLLKLLVASKLEKEMNVRTFSDELTSITDFNKSGDTDLTVFIATMLLQMPQLDMALREILFRQSESALKALPNGDNKFYLSVRLLVSNPLDENYLVFINDALLPLCVRLMESFNPDFEIVDKSVEVVYLHCLLYLYQSNCYYMVKDYDEAFKFAYHVLGLVNLLLTEGCSFEFYRRALKRISADAYRSCAAVFMMRGDYDDAEEMLRHEFVNRRYVASTCRGQPGSSQESDRYKGRLEEICSNFDFLRQIRDKVFYTPRVLAIHFKQIYRVPVFPQAFQ